MVSLLALRPHFRFFLAVLSFFSFLSFLPCFCLIHRILLYSYRALFSTACLATAAAAAVYGLSGPTANTKPSSSSLLWLPARVHLHSVFFFLLASGIGFQDLGSFAAAAAATFRVLALVRLPNQPDSRNWSCVCMCVCMCRLFWAYYCCCCYCWVADWFRSAEKHTRNKFRDGKAGEEKRE